MKAENEIAVDVGEFKKAVSWTSRGRAAARDQTLLYFSDEGFVVEAPRARTIVKSAGRWKSTVAVNASLLKRLLSKFPKNSEVTLLYFEGQLTVGSTRIPATVVHDRPVL